jgi:hypothetical protein
MHLNKLIMSRCKQVDAQLSRALHSCPALRTRIGLKGLACLSTCNKTLSRHVTDLLCADSLGYLDSALDIARSTKQQQHQQALAWLAALLMRSAPATTAAVAERLLSLPNVALGFAEQLVAAGMRITYAQLLAAADSMVAGVEVWVQAQQALGIKTDIPAVAVAICDGDFDLVVSARKQGNVWSTAFQVLTAPGATSAALQSLCDA